MKKGKKRLTILGLIMAMLIGVISYPALDVKAEEIYVKNGNKITLIKSAQDKLYTLYFTDVHGTVTKVKASSSKKSVATVEYFGYGLFYVRPKKAGSTKITINVIADGKKVTRKCTVKIVNFKQPFKSLKINGKSYTKKIKGSDNTIYTKTSKFKFNYKLNPGWKVVHAWGYRGSKVVNLKSGKTYSQSEVRMSLKNKKTGEIIEVDIR